MSEPRLRYCAFHPDLGHDAVLLLEPLGWCEAGEGYPTHWTRPPGDGERMRGWYPLRCPFVCPRCRHDLSWNGACYHCYGSDTPSDPRTWNFTGDYYEPDKSADSGRRYSHYQRVHGRVPFDLDKSQDNIKQLRALVSTIADRSDANGQGISRRLRGCACEKCVEHFKRLAEPPPTPTEEAS